MRVFSLLCLLTALFAPTFHVFADDPNTYRYVSQFFFTEKNADGIPLQYKNVYTLETDYNNEHTDTLSTVCILTSSPSYIEDIDGRLTIPEKAGGYAIHNIDAEAFARCILLTEVIIPPSIETIGDGAFCDCPQLATVSLSEGLKEIGGSAFKGCNAIEVLTIPSTVSSIADNAFANCSQLKRVEGLNFSSSLGRALFANCKNLTGIDFSKASGKFGNAFAACPALTEVTLPEGVTEIGNEAFEGCGNLKSISLPSSLEAIGSYAFRYCKALEEITLPDSLKYIYSKVFEDCTKLKSVKRLNLSACCGESIFMGCDSLETLDSCYATGKIGPSVNGAGVFSYWGGLKHLELPEGVTAIERGTYANCYNLKSIVFPSSLKSIGQNVFAECKSLEQVHIPATVESIGTDVFSYCTALKNATVPKLTSNMFVGCKSLTGVTITSSYKMIPSGVFGGCSSLSEIDIPYGVVSIGNGAFWEAGIRAITFPETMKVIGSSAFTYCNVSEIISYIRVPFPIDDSCFSPNTKYQGTLYVPAGTRQLYEATSGWDFHNIVEMEQQQGIDGIAASEAQDGCYDLQGRRLRGTPDKELYISGGRKFLAK